MAEEDDATTNTKKKSSVIKIPSYDEVMETSLNPKSQPSLFNPSSSFSQAFSFIKKSEFYTPPPMPSNHASDSRQNAQSETPYATPSHSASVSTSTSAPLNPSSSSSQSNQSRNAILASHRQKGNPLLKHIRNVRWNFADIVGDFLLGQNSCALYLSLRYHLLHPDYLYYRIRELQKNYKLRIVLCHVDVEDVVKPLLEVTKTALLHDCTLLCGWSLEECGRYLETIKVYENKSAELIQGQMDTDYLSRLNNALTTIRRVNKTDIVTLGSTFGSLSHIMDASMEDLARCPGIGERKVRRLYETFHEPFKRVIPSRPTIPEPPVENAEASSAEAAEAVEDSGKRKKKDPDLSVKSALSAVYSKYTDKLGKAKKKNKLQEEETQGTSLATETENRNPG